MLITPSNLDALFISFSQIFRDAYMSVPQPLVESIGARLPSNTRDQRYPFVQSLTGFMRQWQGERQIQNVVVDGFVVTNKKYENTLAIERTDIEDDQYGVYSGMLIPNLARHAKMLADTEIANSINNNDTCFDGKAMFAADHYIDPSAKTGSQSNALTGKPLSGTNLAIAQAAMMSFVGPDNKPMGIMGDTILVPPSLKYVADVIANSTFFPEVNNSNSAVFGAQANPWKGQYRVVVSPYLTDSGDPSTAVWYLLDCRNASMRPFFWQEREAAQLVQLVDPSNPIVFMQDQYLMGARARGAASPALWFQAVRVSGA